MSESTKKPAYKTTHGGVNAAVWANQGKEGAVFHSVTFERTYKDGEDYKTSASYGISTDLANLERCIFDVKVWQAMQNQK
jgi:hypothetical protein